MMMTCLTRAGMIAGAAMVLTACAATPTVENLSLAQPGADVTFSKSYEGLTLGVAATQIYSLSSDGSCEDLKRATWFTWTKGAETTLRITPDVPVYVYAGTNYISTASVSMVGNTPVANVAEDICIDAVSFTPESGHSYAVKQPSHFRVPGCRIQITDKATGAAVADIKPAPGLIGCGQKKAPAKS